MVELELNIGCFIISCYLKDLEMWLGMVFCYWGRGGFVFIEEGKCIYEFI